MSTTIVIDTDAQTVTGPAPTLPAAGKRRTWLIAAVGGLLALAGVGGGAYYFLAGSGGHADPAKASEPVSNQAYVDVPQINVNLRSTDGRSRFLKLHFMLVAADANGTRAIKDKLPLYLDALQPFVRELRPEDLNGSAAVYRMKEEMMTRARDAFGGGVVQDVLIQDLVEQ